MAKETVYVLDTNVLVHDPTALFRFTGASIGIPAIVLEELDAFKREATDRGRNSREVARILDSLREHGSLKDGIALDKGGTLRVLFLEDPLPKIPFNIGIADNEILLTAASLKEKGYSVKFISKDINARVKADALGIPAEDYLKEYVSEDEFYRGWIRLQVPSVQLKQDMPKDLELLPEQYKLTPNEFVLVESQHNPHNHRVFRFLGGKRFKPVYAPAFKWPLKPRNAQQLMALDLLLDDDIKLVNLLGPAGTGKTFIALLAGLHKVLVQDIYEKMLISRPVVPLGKDIGYLPGDVQEKLHNWMLPIYDNMEFIMHSANVGRQQKELAREGGKGKKKQKKHHKRDGRENGKDRANIMSLDDLIFRGKISLEAITYMRGRSIPYQYILIDEAQNLTPHEVKTIISRAGQGSKIILAGDPYQIDAPYLDFSSNGLVRTSEKFKGQKIFGNVYLEISERSQLSQLASELL